MAENGRQSEKEEFRGAQVQVLGTNQEQPEKGRIFVWTKMGWFERLVEPSGSVAFTSVAGSEKELREYILRDNPEAELGGLGGKYSKKISEEFVGQSRSDPDSPEDSAGESDEDSDEDDQEYHQHGL